MINYLLLCAISIFAGKGILRILRINIDLESLFYLSPIVTLSFWAILLGSAVVNGYTIKQVYIPIWMLTFLFVIFGVGNDVLEMLRRNWQSIILVLILPMILMVSYFWYGLSRYAGSPACDGWAYVAIGQYLWTYVRGIEGGIAPLYQYAAHLSYGRFIAASLLGFFSPIAGILGDTQAASGLFLAWAFFIFTSACMFFARVQKLGVYSFFYVTFVVLSGWLLKLLWVNNYDNALILGFLPVLAGLVDIIDYRKYRWSFVFAGLIAAAVYCYPEMVIFVIAGVSLFLLNSVCNEKRKLFFWMTFLFITAVLFFIFIYPYMQEGCVYIVHQFNSAIHAQNGSRPGEGMFAELLQPKFMISAYWGLGHYVFYVLISVILTCLAVLGAIRVFMQKQWGLVVFCLILILASLIMIFYQRYSYGAYKNIILNLWLLIFFVFIGVKYILIRYRSKTLYVLFTIAFILFIAKHFIVAWYLNHKLPVKNIVRYRSIAKISEYTENNPVIVAINNDFANQWAVYYLRYLPINLVVYRAYMAETHNQILMRRAKQYDFTRMRYILTDNPISFPKYNLLKSYPPYYLWYLSSSWVMLGDIKNANSIEQWNGQMGFWIGNGDTVVSLLSNTQGKVKLSGTFVLGPSIKDGEVRHLLILGPQNYRREVVFKNKSQLSFIIPVNKGENKVILRALDKPTILKLPSGDTRPMLIGVLGLQADYTNHKDEKR